MVNMVLALRQQPRQGPPQDRDRVLDDRHFEFRGRLSAGALDDQRRSRLEERQDRRDSSNDENG
jgi:hypothetical protein